MSYSCLLYLPSSTGWSRIWHSLCQFDVGALSMLKTETLKREPTSLLNGRHARCFAHGRFFVRLQYYANKQLPLGQIHDPRSQPLRIKRRENE